MFSELLKSVLNLGIITVDDVNRSTAIELIMLLIERTNGLIQIVGDIEGNIKDTTIEQLNKWLEDGTLELIINQTALKNISDRLSQIGQSPIRLADETDDTQAIQRVIDSDKPLYVDRDLVVSDTIRLKLTSVIMGKGKNSCSITMTNDNKWMFRLLTDKRESPYDVVTSLKIHDVCLIGKNILQLNELTESEFDKLGHIKGGSIERVLMKGKVSGGNITSDIPTADELRAGGVAIQATKCFDMAIRDSEISRFGIGVDFLGCDINLIDNCRIAYCQRNYNGKRISTYGSQNKIKNCDLMHASKKGHIYLDGTRWDTIEDNYFECYSAQGMFITGKKLLGPTIINNRFDANGVAETPEIQLSPITQVSVMNNRFNTGEVKAEIKILETDYQNYYRNSMSRVDGNTGNVNLTIPPMYNGSRESDYFNASNVFDINGQIAQSYPFELVDGLWKLKKSGNVVITLKPKIKSMNYKLAFNTRDTDGTYHVNIFKNTYGGTAIKKGPINKGTAIVIANDCADLDAFVIEFVASTADLESIRVINVYE